MERPSLVYPLLLTDCSALGVRAGILGDAGWLAYGNYSGEVSGVLFDAVKDLIRRTEASLEDLAGFAFCEGPGSTLGIRVNAMALRTWNSLGKQPRPVFAFKSLEAAAMMVKQAGMADPPFTIFSDLRKDAWNACAMDRTGELSPMKVAEKAALADWAGKRFFVRQRLYSPGPPAHAEALGYDLKAMGANPAFLGLLRRVEKPAAYQTNKTEFKKWVPQRHR